MKPRIRTWSYPLSVWLDAREEVRAILTQVASKQTYITYAQLAARVKTIRFHHHDSSLHDLLGQVSELEHAEGRGMLSAVVINQLSFQPGSGFFGVAKALKLLTSDQEAFWNAEVKKVWAIHQGDAWSRRASQDLERRSREQANAQHSRAVDGWGEGQF